MFGQEVLKQGKLIVVVMPDTLGAFCLEGDIHYISTIEVEYIDTIQATTSPRQSM